MKTARTLRAIGAWLQKAVRRGPGVTALNGFMHDRSGFLYAADGYRVHGIDRMSDRSGKARCPCSSEVIDCDEVPDIGRVVQSCIREDYLLTVNPTHLYAAAAGLAMAAKRGGFTQHPLHLDLWGAPSGKHRIDLAIAGLDGLRAEVRAVHPMRIEARVPCEWSPSVATVPRRLALRASHLVDAVEGMVAFGGDPTLEVGTGSAGRDALHLRMASGVEADEPIDAFALLLPLEDDDDGIWRQPTVAGL